MKYLDYANAFRLDLAMDLIKHTEIHNYSFNLIEGKEPSHSPIYSLGLVELETLKTYIKTHFKTSFIYSSKFIANIPILFN